MVAHEIAEHIDDGYRVIELRSPAGVEADFVPELSMLGASLRFSGAELLQRDGLATFAETRRLQGIPILHPWANRLEGDTYAAGGPRVHLDATDARITRDRNGLPIHGMLLGAIPWQIVDCHAGADEARLSARFAFAPEDDLTQRFPFPHEIEVRIRLRETSLRFETILRATGDQAVPIAFGFHPYFRLPGEARRNWLVALPVRRRLVLDERMIPTGREETWAYPLAPLGDRRFDDGFAGVEDGDRFLLQGKHTRITVEFESGFPFAQVYAPLDRDTICFEPMTAPANALVSGEHLRRLPPGEEFQAAWAIHLERV